MSLSRRTILKGAALGLGVLGAEIATRATGPAARIKTVLGPIKPDSLGVTLMHEHILVDFVGADRIAPGRYDREEVIRTVLPHLQELRAAGCRTLVECTPAFLGRDPSLLTRLSEASSLQIVTNTGIYGASADKYVPRFAFQETAEQLAARWTREARKGIPPTGVRPGFIKTGTDAGPLSPINRRLVSAAALTHLRTGLVIASHTGDGVAAMAQLDVLKKYAVPLSSWIWVHAQNERDREMHRRAAEMGAWVEFDGISEQTLELHVELVMGMKRMGLLNRVLISQDAGWYHVGEPAGGSFRGYDFLFSRFILQARKSGLEENDIHLLLVENPQRALTPMS
jgi:predicted metal-dependent phosphotriesterase family hydrolase